MPESSTPRAVQLCHETIVWMVPQLDKFPRVRRFTLGERIESGLLNVLASLVEATYARSNKSMLRQANRDLAVVRHVWRMSLELNTISRKRYLYGANLLVQLGRQIGGWLKHPS